MNSSFTGIQDVITYHQKNSTDDFIHSLDIMSPVTSFVIGLIIALLNGYSLVMLLMTKELRTNRHYMIVISLTTSELFLGITLIMWASQRYLFKTLSNSSCLTIMTLFAICVCQSVSQVFLICVERYLAVTKHLTLLKKIRLLGLILLTWSVSITIVITSFMTGSVQPFKDGTCQSISTFGGNVTVSAVNVSYRLLFLLATVWMYALTIHRIRLRRRTIPFQPPYMNSYQSTPQSSVINMKIVKALKNENVGSSSLSSNSSFQDINVNKTVTSPYCHDGEFSEIKNSKTAGTKRSSISKSTTTLSLSYRTQNGELRINECRNDGTSRFQNTPERTNKQGRHKKIIGESKFLTVKSCPKPSKSKLTRLQLEDNKKLSMTSISKSLPTIIVNETENDVTSDSSDAQVQQRQQQVSKRMRIWQRRVICAVGAIIVLEIVCFLPGIITVLATTQGVYTSPRIMFVLTNVLVMMHSLGDPIIYMWHTRDFRKKAFHTCCGKKRCFYKNRRVDVGRGQRSNAV